MRVRNHNVQFNDIFGPTYYRQASLNVIYSKKQTHCIAYVLCTWPVLKNPRSRLYTNYTHYDIGKLRQSRSKIKTMMTVFFYYRGVVHSKFLLEGQTVNKEWYLNVMKHSREQIHRKRADLWKENSSILHHDKAPPHKDIIVDEFLAKNSTNIIEQPSYSPDMASADFFLFPKLKLPLLGTRFQLVDPSRVFWKKWLLLFMSNVILFNWIDCLITYYRYFTRNSAIKIKQCELDTHSEMMYHMIVTLWFSSVSS